MKHALSIDEHCDDFEEGLRSGKAVSIEVVLERAGDSQRHELLRELLAIELEYRMNGPAAVDVDEYLARFPENLAIVTEAVGQTAKRLESTVIAPQTPVDEIQTENTTEVPHVDGYDIGKQLGKGALGVVYQATQLGTDRPVAIKFIRPELESHERVRKLFVREASIATQLKHSRIVDSIGFGFAGNSPWLAMEYVPTVDVEAVAMQHNPKRRVRLCVKVLMSLLDGLQHAHDLGIVHRDMKLSNVLAYQRSKRLQVKISDFGLAKVFLTAGHSGITDSNDICGTLAYMSPEQIADSRNAGPDCDVYASVVCLFRLLTGRFPHPEGTAAEVIYQRAHLNATPVQSLNAEVSDELARIIDFGLSRHREMRFATAAQLSDALRSVPDLARDSS